jgi:hypothetical protein
VSSPSSLPVARSGSSCGPHCPRRRPASVVPRASRWGSGRPAPGGHQGARPLPAAGGLGRSRLRRVGVISPREYGVRNGRRRDSHAREATGPSSRLRRCGHRTCRDPRGGLGLCVCYRVDRGTWRGARGKACFGFNARPTRIAAEQPRRRATPAAASLRAAGRNSDLKQLSRPGRRAERVRHRRR